MCCINILGQTIFDTHFTPEMEQTVRIQWGYEIYYSSFPTNSIGISILF